MLLVLRVLTGHLEILILPAIESLVLSLVLARQNRCNVYHMGFLPTTRVIIGDFLASTGTIPVTKFLSLLAAIIENLSFLQSNNSSFKKI